MQAEGTSTPAAPDGDAGKSHAYDIFILVLTVLSLVVMVLLVLPLNSATTTLLEVYDNVICVVFLIDFFMRLRRAGGKYFFGERGWLDLIGSVPSFGFFKFTALLRLARLSRLARITRLLRGENKRELVDDLLAHRGQYAAFITILAAGIVLVVASIAELQFESGSPDANIKTGGEALWWSIVTITTVGYGDFFPTTTGGRITAAFVMFAGIGIIGALASILASLLVTDRGPDTGQEQTARDDDRLRQELTEIHRELAALRDSLTADGGPPPA